MSLRGAELSIQRKVTQAFVSADSVQLKIRRPIRTSNHGSWSDDYENGTEHSAVVRILPQSDVVPESRNNNGVIPTEQHVMLAASGTDVLRGDEFEWRGSVWRVSHTHLAPEYESKWDIVRHRESDGRGF